MRQQQQEQQEEEQEQQQEQQQRRRLRSSKAKRIRKHLQVARKQHQQQRLCSSAKKDLFITTHTRRQLRLRQRHKRHAAQGCGVLNKQCGSGSALDSGGAAVQRWQCEPQ